jgi:hypothetical protein
VRGAIAIGWAGMAASLLFLVFSPIPALRAASDFVAAEDNRARATPAG